MIYSDGVHVVSDVSIEDLHEQMQKIGIKRCWYHSSSKHKHYDIPKRKRETFFIDNPEVQKVTPQRIVEICKHVEVMNTPLDLTPEEVDKIIDRVMKEDPWTFE